MKGSTYLLDANVLIEAARRYYAFDFAPKFWDSLLKYAGTDRILSIDRIKEELNKGHDELAEWANTHFSSAFVTTDSLEVIEMYAQVMVWVEDQQQFSDAGKAEFAAAADGWLVAYANVNDCILVTHEALAPPEARRKVQIPNVCRAFDVTWVDTFAMLRDIGVRFT